MSITQDQLKAVQDKVATLVADKQDEDAKTAVSNQADTDAATANAKAAQAKVDEQAASSKTAADLQDLTHLLETLTAPPAAPAS